MRNLTWFLKHVAFASAYAGFGGALVYVLCRWC